MKKLLLVLAVAGLLMGAVQAIAYAQDKPLYWFVREQVVRPDRVLDFHTGVMEQFAEAAKHKIPYYRMDAWSSNDFHYYFAIVIEGPDSLDDLAAAWARFHADLKSKMGDEAYNKLMKKLEGTVEYDHDFVFVWRPDLSYLPQAPRLKPGERNFIHWQYWYIKDGMEQEAEAVTKEIAILFKDKGVVETLEVNQALLGGDVPAYYAAWRGKDEVDYYAHDVNKLLANDKAYNALLARLYKTTRQMVRVNVDYRLDLSYHPETVK